MSDYVLTSPINGETLREGRYCADSELAQAIQDAHNAQAAWAARPLSERLHCLGRFVERVMENSHTLSEELTQQMGRPIQHSPYELKGFEHRANTMLSLAESALAPIVPNAPTTAWERRIQRNPKGLVFLIAPWNYPYLTVVNALIPALAAGNSVILKAASQTLLTGERLFEAAMQADLPMGLFQSLALTHDQSAKLIQQAANHVVFTGSVEGGHAIRRAAASRFISTTLELGGKDAAYVRWDANLPETAKQLVDGAYFNAGQSCCGIERIFVHDDVYESFIEHFVTETKTLVLGDPMDPHTTLGPMATQSAKIQLQARVAQSIRRGGMNVISRSGFEIANPENAYMAPQAILNLEVDDPLFHEEVFGPVVCIAPVSSDKDAIARINHSRFGLTASLWSEDRGAIEHLGPQLQVGTVFANRCDYVDPYLAWTGLKDTGMGVSLSELGFESFVQPQSFYYRSLSE